MQTSASGGSRTTPQAGQVGAAAGATRGSRSATLSFHHLEHHARDVISRALIEGELPEAFGELLHVGRGTDLGCELVVGDDTSQAVGAEQEAVARLNLD